ELDPRLPGPYLRLGLLYAVSGNPDRGLARVNEALKAKPDNLGALMLSGAIYEQKGDVQKAQAAYEKALAINPRFAPAANNLAYLYTEQGASSTKDRALALAQMAKEVDPDDPHVSDTLGWILYKRGVYGQALSLLQEAASKLPDSPAIQYHLGMTAAKTGDRQLAKKVLAQAVDAQGSFPWKED